MMRGIRLLVVAVAIAIGVSVTNRAEMTGPIDLAISGRANATPSLAALDRFVIVVWGASVPAGGMDVYTAVSHDAGVTFGAPVRVNDLAGDARLNGEQPPHVVLAGRTGRDPLITIVWTSKRPTGTWLRRSQSQDGGRSFTPATTVPGTDAAGNRGWEAIAIDRSGRVAASWLDHRDVAAPAAGAAMTHAAHDGSGANAAQKSKLYFASIDGALPARAITGGVCYCCKTAIAAGADGAVYIAWRHVYPGDLRDIAFVSSRDGGKTFSAPQRISEDGWAINGCPENGPAMVVDGANTIHVAWPTLVAGAQPTLGLFYAASTDGHTFSPRRRIPTSGTAAHAQLALVDQGGLVLVWDELKNGARQIMMSRRAGTSAASEFAAPVVLTLSANGTYPVVAGVPGAVVVAWTSRGGDASVIRVQRVSQ